MDCDEVLRMRREGAACADPDDAVTTVFVKGPSVMRVTSFGMVTHIPIVRQRLGKQARNKYATNNRLDPLLGNARSTRTHATTEQVLQEVFLVRVTLRLAVYRQSVRLGAKLLETHGQNSSSQLNTCGHSPYITSSLTRDASVIYNCCWPSPSYSFSGPSPVGLATIFYCLRFGTSHFVASYDSQGYCGGIRPRLHTRILREVFSMRVCI
jgi:hypothetical protein